MPHPGNVQTWLNPPTDTWPERWVLLELDPDKTRIAAEAFAAQADAIKETDSQRARVLRSLAYQFRHAVLTPEEADKKNISTLDTMHPANQLSRLLGTALTGDRSDLGEIIYPREVGYAGDRSDLGEIIYPRARQTVGGSAELGVSAEVQGSDAVRIRVLNEQLTGTGLTGQPRS